MIARIASRVRTNSSAMRGKKPRAAAPARREYARRCPGRTSPAPSRRRRRACAKNGQSRAISASTLHRRAWRWRARSAAADAVPRGEAGAILRPREHPRDRAQRARRPPASPARCGGREPMRRRSITSIGVASRKYSGKPGVFVHQRAIVRARRRRPSAAILAPARLARLRRRAAAASRAAPRRWPARGCAAPARGCRTCGGSLRPARSARRQPSTEPRGAAITARSVLPPPR